MDHRRSAEDLLRAQFLGERAFTTLQRFLHVEAVSGGVLLIAAAAALIWANSPFAHGYYALWHLPLSIGLGEFVFSRSLHFWINDALMTVFFLVVGMEIRREIHEGALRKLDQAILPVAAAAGGVSAPALIYLSLNTDPVRNRDRHRLCRGGARAAGAINPGQCENPPAGSSHHRRRHRGANHRFLLLRGT
jgi:NhaA family Na+:H+ antiporter